MIRPRILIAAGVTLLTLLFLPSCDTGITGSQLDNQAPDTQLSVRDESLVDNLAGADRLSSTVNVSWSGTDPDGFVASYEIRFYALEDTDQQGPDNGWSSTTRLDSLILLPIKMRESTANVVFEVRAVDNAGAKDPSPAKSVFPIQNSPPEIRLNSFELPPSETFPVFSVGWEVRDPEGEQNIDRIEIALNDSVNYTVLDADVRFITLVGDVDRTDPTQTTADAEVYVGRSFQRTGTIVPGMKLDAENILYARVVDQTDTASVAQTHTFRVVKPKSDVLFVNDYRKSVASVVQGYHLRLLESYLPPEMTVDVWDLSMPWLSSSSGASVRSDGLPANQDPTIRQTLAYFKYIYWVSTNTTNSGIGNNLPFVSAASDIFFENGGKMMVHTPISLPNDPEEALENSAILLLPLSGLIAFPDSLRASLRLGVNATIEPTQEPPGSSIPLPTLTPQGLVIGTLPFEVAGTNIIPLYKANYSYLTKEGGRQGPWPGSNVVASISEDRRVALFALPLASESNGGNLYIGDDGDFLAPQKAVFSILESLGFPKAP